MEAHKKPRVILVCGTPGTGKSIASKLIKSILENVTCMSVSVKAFEWDLTIAYDFERDTHIIDFEKLSEKLREEVEKLLRSEDNKIIVIETPYPCILPDEIVDLVIVLKCPVNVLLERLERREWPKIKIEENIESERLNVVLEEALTCFKPEKVVCLESLSVEDLKRDLIQLLVR